MHLNLFLQWLAANIDASNAIRVWLAADKLSLLNLKDVCFDYILAHKQEVLRRVDLGQLPVDVLNTILAHREVQDQVVSLNTHKPNELSSNLLTVIICRSFPLVETQATSTLHSIHPSALSTLMIGERANNNSVPPSELILKLKNCGTS